MSCSVIQPTLQALFPYASTLTITRSLNSTQTPGGEATLKQAGLAYGNGLVFAQLWYDGTEQFYCRGTGCSQTVGPTGSGSVNGSTWTCPALNCTCRPGTDLCGGPKRTVSGKLLDIFRADIQPAAEDLSQPINGLTGPLVIDCKSDGTCSFQQSFLVALFGQTGLQLSSCSYGECVEQYVIDQAIGILATTTTASGLSAGVIAGLAVVGAILLAILGVIIWGVVARKRARRDMRTDGKLPRSGGVGVSWSAVGYEVKALDRGGWSRAVAWLKGSGGRRVESEGGDAVGPSGGKIVLREAYGQLPAGAFCCILGPSGAGKSTLVDILAGKRKAGRVEGKVSFARDEGRRVKIGYVDQSDVLSPTSTVLETLLFAAHLRLPENIPSSVKIARAETVLGQLGLNDVAHTRVGSVERRGISGGEMRRVSIGIELVAAPDVLVLDEPTSGLDSVSASRLVKLLKNLAETEKTTIIASIHQPSSALYHSFDLVVLLAQGRQLYFGPGGSRPSDFFAGHGRQCPAGYNIADHLLEIASGSIEGLPSGQAAMLLEASSTSREGSSTHSSDDKLLAHHTRDSETPLHEKSAYPPVLNNDREVDLAKEDKPLPWYAPPSSHCATTFLTQLEVLSGREWRNIKRDKTLLIAHLLLACVLGVFAGGLYFKVSLTIAGFQNRVGSLFFLGSLIAFSSLRSVSTEFGGRSSVVRCTTSSKFVRYSCVNVQDLSTRESSATSID